MPKRGNLDASAPRFRYWRGRMILSKTQISGCLIRSGEEQGCESALERLGKCWLPRRSHLQHASSRFSRILALANRKRPLSSGSSVTTARASQAPHSHLDSPAGELWFCAPPNNDRHQQRQAKKVTMTSRAGNWAYAWFSGFVSYQ